MGLRSLVRPLVLAAGLLCVTATAASARQLTGRMADPRHVFSDEERTRWNRLLDWMLRDSGVDFRIRIDSVPPRVDLAAYTINEARRVGMGRTSDRQGVFLMIDLASGNLRMEIGSRLEGIFTDGFVGRILRAHTSDVLRHETMSRSINSTLMLLQHRIRESTLNLAHDPRARSAITDSTRLAAGGGATFTMAAGGPLELDRKPDPRLETLLGPGKTPEETLRRHSQWLSLPVYVPRARFLTSTSRVFYEHSVRITPAYWEFLRYLYIGTEMKVETRGEHAIAYATRNPLITPLFFRRGPDGWEMDTMAELRNSQNILGHGYNWQLRRGGDDFDRIFSDRMVQVGSFWRFKDGANQPYKTRGTFD